MSYRGNDVKSRTLCTATAFLLTATFALASGPPPLKEGLWLLNRQTIDNPGNKKEVWPPIRICRDHAYDQYVLDLAKKVPGCTTVSESMRGDTYLVDLNPAIGKTTLDTKSTTIVQNDIASHGESHTTYTRAIDGVSRDDHVLRREVSWQLPRSDAARRPHGRQWFDHPRQEALTA